MRRREFLALVGGSVAWPRSGVAQQLGPMPRIGVLLQVPPSEPVVAPLWKALLEGLHEHGWEDGRNLIVEGRFGGRDVAGFGALAADLVRLQVRAILAANPHSIAGARRATSTTPIVMLGGIDPVRSGWVKSLARPEGNLTGLAVEGEALIGKHIELLREIDQSIARVAVLYSPASAISVAIADILRIDLGPRLGMTITPMPVTTDDEVVAAFGSMARDRPQGLVVLGGDAVLQTQRVAIAQFAIGERLPTVTGLNVLVRDGLLMSYAHDPAAAFRRAGWYVDRILKGAPVEELPIELMNRFQLALNLKTANALGLTIPPTLLARADEVIE